MIKAVDLSFRINRKNILRNVSFELEAGELMVILGSNGAGKSTLLKLLSGELEASAGYIALDQKDLSRWNLKELAKFRAVLHQQTILTLPFKAGEVVMMGRYPHFGDRPLPIDQEIVENALKRTGTTHLSDRNYLTLSGGEQQRIHLARVFAQVGYSSPLQTRYLFMDEPLNSLDIRHQHATLELVKEFTNEGHCVVAVLHDLNLAMQYADKALMLRNGQTICFGSARKVFRSDTISNTYDFPLQVVSHSCDKHPVIVPAFTTNKITT